MNESGFFLLLNLLNQLLFKINIANKVLMTLHGVNLIRQQKKISSKILEDELNYNVTINLCTCSPNKNNFEKLGEQGKLTG